MNTIVETNLKSLKLVSRGKVRDIYKYDKNSLLIISTDRISAYDKIMKEGIPGKGIILNKLSSYWKMSFSEINDNDIISDDVKQMNKLSDEEKTLCMDRAVLVKELNVFPVEFIIRGYLAGNGWKQYSRTGKINDIVPPQGLSISDRLPLPAFTPTTKEIQGHDRSLSWIELVDIIGEYTAEKLKDIAVKLYKKGSEISEMKGITIADTKFEFAKDENGKIYLIDEVLTPDSSRFWATESVISGSAPPSYDKQILRNWLDENNWDRESAPPSLPDKLIKRLSDRYSEILNKFINNGS